MSTPDRHPVLTLLAITAVVVAMPLLWRTAVSQWGPATEVREPSYLPSLEATRARRPFDPTPIEQLRTAQPEVVVVGDSMTRRIHYPRLGELAGGAVVSVHANSTGSAYWYLTFKNYVVASGVRPQWVLVFFRDTHLTDPFFRLTERHRAKVDEVALAAEPELDRVLGMRTRGPWNAVHRRVEDAYQIERAREWLEPALLAWPARVVIGTTRRDALLTRVNEAFDLEHLRAIEQADVDTAEDDATDFHGNVEASVLPLFIELARERGLRLCFVRVLRRPVGGQPPRESRQLRQYVRDLSAYLASEGVHFIDDRDDRALWQLPYADGDHVADEARLAYTEQLWPKLTAHP